MLKAASQLTLVSGLLNLHPQTKIWTERTYIRTVYWSYFPVLKHFVISVLGVPSLNRHQIRHSVNKKTKERGAFKFVATMDCHNQHRTSCVAEQNIANTPSSNFFRTCYMRMCAYSKKYNIQKHVIGRPQEGIGVCVNWLQAEQPVVASLQKLSEQNCPQVALP